MTDTQTTEILYVQPVETKVKVEIKTNAKGELQPEVEIYITRKMDKNTYVGAQLQADIDFVTQKVKEALEKLK